MVLYFFMKRSKDTVFLQNKNKLKKNMLLPKRVIIYIFKILYSNEL